jgi:hypothetical protein
VKVSPNLREASDRVPDDYSSKHQKIGRNLAVRTDEAKTLRTIVLSSVVSVLCKRGFGDESYR